MCGIGGIVFWDGRRTDANTVEGILSLQSHRGPDGNGVWCNDGVALAHNRLAIIDLYAGLQPMQTVDGKYVIVYNGEIYNFKELRKDLESYGHIFKTTSDTEVILKSYVQWGVECLKWFRGMFAFAIWDRPKKTLFVARDRLGIKPLYFYMAPGFFVFASELQGLMSVEAVPKKLDLCALDLYLHYQYIPAPLTIYSGVCKLLPAHYLLLGRDNPDQGQTKYWDVKFIEDRTLSVEDWKVQLGHEIGESVRMHLVADVPFGAFLSGGIDSSSVVYHMSRCLDIPVKTYTIGFNDAAYDERKYAQSVAMHVNSQHNLQVVDSTTFNLLDELIYKLAMHYGEPFADSSAIPTYFVSKLAASEVKMVLSGDGGDELFAGYNTYTNILNAMSNGKPKIVDRLLRKFFPVSSAGGILDKAKSLLSEEALYYHGMYYAYFRDEERKKLYRPDTEKAVEEKMPQTIFRNHFFSGNAGQCLPALQYLDIKTYLPGDILTKVDIASMIHSLEVRVPLLDYKVVEFAARVPSRLKLMQTKDGEVQKKYIFKKYVEELFPPGLFDRPKQGFGVPIDNWFGGRLYKDVKARIESTKGILYDLFDFNYMSELVSSPESASNNCAKIWALLFLQAWSEKYEFSVC